MHGGFDWERSGKEFEYEKGSPQSGDPYDQTLIIKHIFPVGFLALADIDVYGLDEEIPN